jgi:hypothetical protein
MALKPFKAALTTRSTVLSFFLPSQFSNKKAIGSGGVHHAVPYMIFVVRAIYVAQGVVYRLRAGTTFRCWMLNITMRFLGQQLTSSYGPLQTFGYIVNVKLGILLDVTKPYPGRNLPKVRHL